MSRFANLAEKAEKRPETTRVDVAINPGTAPSRLGRKAISGYFSPELSMALHHCARKHDRSLLALMAEAFNDVLRKYGESPVGE
jgi:hypothetical protein